MDQPNVNLATVENLVSDVKCTNNFPSCLDIVNPDFDGSHVLDKD